MSGVLDGISPHPEGSSWQVFLRDLLERWHGENAATAGDAATEASLERLSALDPRRRPSFLGELRERLATPAWRYLHPSWIQGALPDDPLVRHGLLRLLPDAARNALGVEMPAGGGDPGVDSPSPRWLPDWWLEELHDRLPCPAPFPWHLREDDPESLLWALEPKDLVRLLELYGLRPLAAAVWAIGRSDQRRAAAIMLSLPDELRGLLADGSDVAAGERGPWLDAPWKDAADDWAEIVDELQRRGVQGRRLSVELAAIDLSTRSETLAERENVLRLAFRLPVELGELVLAGLEGERRPLSSEDAEERRRDLAEDLERLADSGCLTRPDLDALRREVLG